MLVMYKNTSDVDHILIIRQEYNVYLVDNFQRGEFSGKQDLNI